jgi:DNA-binding beta-propeller fold protein YncE
VQRIPVRGLPEGVAFSADGLYVYVSSFKNQELMVFEVIGDSLVDTNVRVALPGTPASMRGRAR